ncbi:MAG: IS256 family transposase [Actinomycetota bacterium]|nr:IS256 family transposase [Actinomycetota bacterium]
MKKTAAPVVQAGLIHEELPVRVQEALGELAAAAREGLLALSVGVGLGVLAELMEEEVVEVVGARGRHDPERVAVRHGHESGEVTLGGRRIAVERPRVRSADGTSELPLATYRYFADRDPLTRLVLERMLAGVSTRRYRRTQEPVGGEIEQRARSTSKSSVSRAFVERTRKGLGELMARRLDDVRLAVMMLDGIGLNRRTNIVALGITTEGVKIPLGLWEGATENATVATALLSDLVERGLDPEQGMLFVIDGSKALRKAIRDVFGEAPVQRCIRHKERNVLEHLPERDRPAVKRRLREAWTLDDHDRALERLKALGAELERSHPGAAGSLQEGIAETLTLTRLGIGGSLRRTLPSTNPCESMIECVRRTSRNVKHWQSGEMALRWTAAGMLEAERQFRRIIGYCDLAKLALAIERDLAGATVPSPTEEAGAAQRRAPVVPFAPVT